MPRKKKNRLPARPRKQGRDLRRWGDWRPVDFSRSTAPPGTWRVQRNDLFIVDLAHVPDPFGRPYLVLKVRRVDGAPDLDWRDLQRIKNELVGREIEGVELFPRADREVDTPGRWLWCLPPKNVFAFGLALERLAEVDDPDEIQVQSPIVETHELAVEDVHPVVAALERIAEGGDMNSAIVADALARASSLARAAGRETYTLEDVRAALVEIAGPGVLAWLDGLDGGDEAAPAASYADKVERYKALGGERHVAGMPEAELDKRLAHRERVELETPMPPYDPEIPALWLADHDTMLAAQIVDRAYDLATDPIPIEKIIDAGDEVVPGPFPMAVWNRRVADARKAYAAQAPCPLALQAGYRAVVGALAGLDPAVTGEILAELDRAYQTQRPVELGAVQAAAETHPAIIELEHAEWDRRVSDADDLWRAYFTNEADQADTDEATDDA